MFCQTIIFNNVQYMGVKFIHTRLCRVGSTLYIGSGSHYIQGHPKSTQRIWIDITNLVYALNNIMEINFT